MAKWMRGSFCRMVRFLSCLREKESAHARLRSQSRLGKGAVMREALAQLHEGQQACQGHAFVRVHQHSVPLLVAVRSAANRIPGTAQNRGLFQDREQVQARPRIASRSE